MPFISILPKIAEKLLLRGKLVKAFQNFIPHCRLSPRIPDHRPLRKKKAPVHEDCKREPGIG
jgi:hypothetical protein